MLLSPRDFRGLGQFPQAAPQPGGDTEAQELLRTLTQIQTDSVQASKVLYGLNTSVVDRNQRVYELNKKLAALKGLPAPPPPIVKPLPALDKLKAEEIAKLKAKPSGFESAAASQGFPLAPVAGGAPFPSLSGLSGSGAQQWLQGQLSKISSMAQAGQWTSMLAELMGITPEAAGKLAQPDTVLADPTIVAALKTKLQQNFPNQAWESTAEIAIDSMVKSLAGQPLPPVPDGADLLTKARGYAFDADAWTATTGADMQYIASHRPTQGVGKIIGKGGMVVLRETNRITTQLDHYVPGWSVLIDVLGAPILLEVALTAVKTLVTKDGNITVNPKRIFPVISAALPFYSPLIGGLGAQVFMIKPIADQAVQFASVVAPINFTVANITWVAVKTNGPLLAKLEAAGLEALADLGMFATIGCVAVTFGAGAPVCWALSAAVSALQVGVTLAKAQEAARAAKNAADAARQRGLAEVARLDAQAAEIQRQIDEIEDLKRQIAAEKAARLKAVRAPDVAVAVPSNQNLLIGGAFAALVVVGVVAFIATSED